MTKKMEESKQASNSTERLADERVLEGVYNDKPLTKSEINWIKRLEKILSKQPKELVGLLSNGESIDFYRPGWQTLYEKGQCPKPLTSISVMGNLDGGAY